MGRGGSIYISTDPNNLAPIGEPGKGISIGPMGCLIYNPNVDVPPDGGTQNITMTGFITNATIDPATDLSALTLTFDSGTVNAQQLFITFEKNITTLSFSGANIATSPALPTTATPGLQISFVWTTVGSIWTRTT